VAITLAGQSRKSHRCLNVVVLLQNDSDIEAGHVTSVAGASLVRLSGGAGAILRRSSNPADQGRYACLIYADSVAPRIRAPRYSSSCSSGALVFILRYDG
jgi:hypothetical protein